MSDRTAKDYNTATNKMLAALVEGGTVKPRVFRTSTEAVAAIYSDKRYGKGTLRNVSLERFRRELWAKEDAKHAAYRKKAWDKCMAIMAEAGMCLPVADSTVPENLLVMDGDQLKLQRLLNKGGGLTCPICDDKIKDPSNMRVAPCGHHLCGECHGKIAASPLTEYGHMAVKCPECRGPLN